jgi:hypothetical protein
MSEPAGDKAAESGSTTFWKTVPGILTGVAALLSATAGLIVVLVQVFGMPGQDPAARSTTESSIAETTDTTTSAPAEAGVLHRDRIEMRDADYADLETGKVGLPPGTDFYLHGTDQLVTGYPMAPVSGPITKASCVEALSSREDRGAHISKVGDDQWLCVQTDEGNLAGMRIVQRPGPGKPSVGFEYVLWK